VPQRPRAIELMVTTPTALPGPLHVLVERADAEVEPFKRTWRLIDAFEWAVKWSAALVLGDVLGRAGVSDRLKLQLAQGLRTPSLGTWLSFYRDALREPVVEDRPWADWDRLVRLEQRHGIVALRNLYGHGAVHRDATSREHWEAYRPVLAQLIAAETFSTTRLAIATRSGAHPVEGATAPVASLPVEGDSWHALAIGAAVEEPIDLWPIGLFALGDDDQNASFYFYNALRREQVERLNYDLPDRVRDRALWASFASSFPLDEWRTTAGRDPDPFARRVDELISTFTGREPEQERLRRFVLDGSGTLVVWGPPGIGKSALLGLVSRELRAGAGGQLVVLDYFIRRGAQEDRPEQFLHTLNRRLDAIYRFTDLHEGTTLEERYEAFGERLRRIERSPRLPTLVLCIDGLDENPDLCRLVPHSSSRIRVVCGSRPVQAVVDFVDRRDGHVEELTLGPLRDEDVRALLYATVDKYRDELVRGDFVRTLRRRSEGNPLFLSLVCNELLAAPDRLGEMTTIPVGLEGAFRDAFHRVTDRGRELIAAEVLLLLAVARETLSPATLAWTLGHRSLQTRAAIEACRELLFRDDTDDARYGLFHDAFRSWLRDQYPEEIDELEAELGRRAVRSLDPRGPALGYLHRHGLRHLERAWERIKDPVLLSELETLWCDPDYLADKLDHQGPLELFADADVWFPRLTRDRVARSLATFVVADATSSDPRLTPEVLHALLVYRPDTALFEAMLVHLTDPAFLADGGLDARRVDWLLASFRYCLGSIHRKHGSPEDLAAAGELLEAAMLPLGAATATRDARTSRLLAKVEYESGYVNFLRGYLAAALPKLDASVRLSHEAGDETGAWISRVVVDRVRYLHGELAPDRWQRSMEEALRRFSADAATSPRADRWVMQTHVHLVELAVMEGDLELARRSLEALEDHPWSRQFNRERGRWIARGRTALLEARYEDACHAYEQALGGVLDAGIEAAGSQHFEALARDLLDYADALDGADRADGAVRARAHAAALPAEAGNHLWQRPGSPRRRRVFLTSDE
jgi:hypothetical protein